MTGLLRKAMLFGCLGVLVATGALASVPSATNSTIPCGLTLVGTAGGVADVKGQFTVTVKDIASNFIAGSSVVVDFNTCSDTRVCSVQSYTGVTSDCTANPGTASAVTNASGVATFRIVGGGRNTAAGSPGAGFKCATIFADGVNLGTVNVAIADENSSGGVNPVDVSLGLADSLRYPGVYVGRTDFNCDDKVNPVDVSLLLGISLASGSTTSCASFCH